MSWLWGSWSRLAASVALVTLILDQANKLWLLKVTRIAETGRVQVLPFLDLTFVLNTGVSFSTGAGALPQWGLSLFAAIASLALMIWVAQSSTGAIMAASVGLIVGGALGNAIDRLWLGGVADFYRLHAFGYSWYVFNLADAAIVAGVFGLLYDSFAPNRGGAPNAP